MDTIVDLKAKVKAAVSEELDVINKRYESKNGVREVYALLDVSFSFGDSSGTSWFMPMPENFSITVEVKERHPKLLGLDPPVGFYEMGTRLKKDFPSYGIHLTLRFFDEGLSECRGSTTFQL